MEQGSKYIMTNKKNKALKLKLRLIQLSTIVLT